MSDPQPSKPAQPAFLPRTWKATPEPEPEPPPTKAKGKGKGKSAAGDGAAAKPPKKPRKKAAAPATDDAGGPKLEETPLLDTYEARQRVRLVLGSVLGVVGLVALIILVRSFQGNSTRVDPAADRAQPRIAVDPKESAEREAAALLNNARQFDKLGRSEAAITLLQKVARNYEGTAAARDAAAALDRDRRNRPLFAVEDPKQPSGPKAPPAVAASTPGAAATPPAASAAPAAPPAAPAPPPKPPEIVARPLPNGFKAETSAPIHPSGWPTRITCDRDGAAMVLIPAGEFLMGREDGEPAERPSHRVRLAAYYIDEHEVTNRQYQAYLRESGRGTGEVPKAINADRLDLPATGLTAREARAYCYWANRRLPTEAQWELAARSEDGRVSYGAREVAKGEAGPRALATVMSDPGDRAPGGGFDFGGNAWEWTSDYYDSQYYHQLRGVAVDPAGPAESRIKPAQVTVKGGSRLGFLTWREGLRIEAKLPQVGFRGALPVEATAAPAAGQPGTPGVNPPGGVIPF